MEIKIVSCGDFSENIVNGIVAVFNLMQLREEKQKTNKRKK